MATGFTCQFPDLAILLVFLKNNGIIKRFVVCKALEHNLCAIRDLAQGVTSSVKRCAWLIITEDGASLVLITIIRSGALMWFTMNQPNVAQILFFCARKVSWCRGSIILLPTSIY